jgi:uncharacterized damage-inducible protein DinB
MDPIINRQYDVFFPYGTIFHIRCIGGIRMSERDLELENLRYPIGRFEWDGVWNEGVKSSWIEVIESQPAVLREAIAGLSEAQLDTPYRPGGWTVRQVVHHLADSHMNSVIRFKLALTEDAPVIKPYREELWAELEDSKSFPALHSLQLLDSLHLRWGRLLRSMDEAQYQRSFYHPENEALVPLRRALGLYAWHGTHHIAQIMALRKREGW